VGRIDGKYGKGMETKKFLKNLESFIFKVLKPQTMTKYLKLPAILLIILLAGCGKSNDDCGAEHVKSIVIYSSDLFSQPTEIYWGVSGSVRSYTYNWTYSNLCTKRNPKVDFIAVLNHNNSSLASPFSFIAATNTCFGLQAQSAAMTPNSGQDSYQSAESEIGMNQCYGGQASGSVYPYLVVSFNTLGSSAADSMYLVNNLQFVKATVVYSDPK
jgi:hypothetical protein